MKSNIYPSVRHELSGVIIEHTSKRMKHFFAKLLYENHQNKITVDQWVVLYQIYKNGPLSQLEIGNFTFKDSPTVTRIIDILLNKNYVVKAIDVQDRRKFTVSLSTEGESLINEIIPTLIDFREMSYQNVSEQELISLEKILNKINFNLNN